MKHIWAIFIQDLRNIKRVPLMGLLLIGIAVLPSLYAWFNLSAYWDPYSNTGNIQIAVVNEDKGAIVHDKEINVGKELENNLRENEDFGWTFVSKEEARRGVRDGTYYASIYIDDAFSNNLIQVLDGKPKPAEIHYEVNEKINAIAPKMTSAGASAIVSSISEQFIKEATKALFTEFHNIGLKLEEELPTIRTLEQFVFEIEDRLPDINRFAEWIIDVDSNWATYEEKVNRFLELKQYFPEIESRADIFLQFEQKIPQIHKMADYVSDLETFMPKLEERVSELDKINDHFVTVNEQLENALKRIETAQTAIERATNALPKLEETAKSTKDYVEALSLFIDRAQGAAEPVIDIVLEQTEYVSHTASSVYTALQKLQQSDRPEEVLNILNKLQPRLETGSQFLQHSVSLFESLNQFLPSKPLQPVIDRLTNTKESIDSLNESITTVIRVGTIAEHEIPSLLDKAKRAEQSASRLHRFLEDGGTEAIIRALSEMDEKALLAGDTITNVYEQLPNVERILRDAEAITIIGEERIHEILDVLPQVEEDFQHIVNRIEESLPSVIDTVEAATRFVNDDLPLLEEKYYRISDFLRDELPKVEEEYDKASGLLERYLPEMERAIHELARFSAQLLPDIENKIGHIADRLREYDDEQLSELIRLLKNDIEEESEFFAKPVELHEEKLFPIPNYGSANAPFYTALSLWVGALLLSNLLSTNIHKLDMKEEYKLHHVYFGRLILFLAVGMLQAIIVSTGNFFILGAYAAHPVWFVVFAIVIDIVFMTIVYTFASILGNIGKAIAVILMVLQLSGAGGTFPIEVAPPFFQMIHSYLPFTYAINLLREAVGGIIPIIAWKQIGALFIFMTLFLIIGSLLKKPLSIRVSKTNEKSKSSRLME